jgi:Zn finger protein HypA/HybF involved in hydrogenase expression
MTFPSEIHPTNIKPREVWCPNCKKITVSDQPNTMCDNCFGAITITVLYSTMTGKRITGNDELGSGDSQSS